MHMTYVYIGLPVILLSLPAYFFLFKKDRKKLSASRFLQNEYPTQMLKGASEIVLDDSTIFDHKETTKNIIWLIKNLSNLSEDQVNDVLNWRDKLRVDLLGITERQIRDDGDRKISPEEAQAQCQHKKVREYARRKQADRTDPKTLI